VLASCTSHSYYIRHTSETFAQFPSAWPTIKIFPAVFPLETQEEGIREEWERKYITDWVREGRQKEKIQELQDFGEEEGKEERKLKWAKERLRKWVSLLWFITLILLSISNTGLRNHISDTVQRNGRHNLESNSRFCLRHAPCLLGYYINSFPFCLSSNLSVFLRVFYCSS
jgi:hypothetical protein